MKLEIVKKWTFEEEDAKRFKKWLITNDLTINAFAKKLDVSLSYLSAIISGTRYLNEELAIKFQENGYNVLRRKLK